MSLETIARTVFAEVRDRYRSTLKSDNKKYDLDSDPIVNADQATLIKRALRNYKADLANSGKGHQQAMKSGLVERYPTKRGDMNAVIQGQALWNMRAQRLNCDELAQMACYRASLHQVQTTLANLAFPADHAFCLIGPYGTLKFAADNYRLREWSTKVAASNQVWVVDVWLNEVCQIRQYPELVAARLETWTGKGKRISWTPPDDDDAIWAPPNGAYRTAFLDAYVGFEEPI
jgi:hypothetical protein